MRRLLFQTAVLLTLGALWPPLVQQGLPSYLFILITFLFLIFSWMYRKRSPGLSSWFLSLSLLLSGTAITTAYLERHPPEASPWIGQEITLQGYVDDMPVRQGQKWAFPVKVIDPFEDRVWVRSERLNFLVTGDLIQMRGRLESPATPSNPGGFNEKEYLFHKGIHAVFTLNKMESIIKENRSGWRYLLLKSREKVMATLHRLFPSGEGAFLGGLLFGWTDQLDPRLEESFSLLGITHILAASGMNVALLAVPVWWFLAKVGMSPQFRLCFLLPLIFFYVGLAGGTPSVLRAGIMAALYYIGKASERPVDLLTLVGASIWISILADPLILWNLGYQLSYGVTIGLILLTPRISATLSFLPAFFRTPLAATLAAELVSVPLLVYHFHVYSPLSILANLYIMPLVAILVPLGFLLLLIGLLFPLLVEWIIPVERGLLFLLVKPVVWLGEKRWLTTFFSSSSPMWLFSYYLGLCFLFAEWAKKVPLRKITSFFLIFAYLAALWHPFSLKNELLVTFLDVGQGDSIYICTPNQRVILVDGGGRLTFANGEYDMGEKRVVPYLQHEGVRQIDMVILTHPDQDHMMGLLSVLRSVPVKRVLISGYPDEGEDYRQFLSLIKEKQIPLYTAKKGERWEVDRDVVMEVLNPPAAYVEGTRRDLNANCIVFSLQYGKHSFLFTGDLEGEAEELLIPELHPVDVLKVAHHGSKYSSSTAFLQAVHPQYGIISVGKNNRYGHPAAETLQRLQKEGVQVIRTDESGGILVHTNGDGLTVETMKPVDP